MTYSIGISFSERRSRVVLNPSLPTPRTACSLHASVPGNLPAIAMHADTVAASCTWRWQAGGGQGEAIS